MGSQKTAVLLTILVIVASLALTLIGLSAGKHKSKHDSSVGSDTTTTTPTPSINTLLCQGYICPYNQYQPSSGVASYEECDKACSSDQNCHFFTVTKFRGQTMCWKLFQCHHPTHPSQDCLSGPRTCSYLLE